MISQRQRILPPYTRRVDDFRHYAGKALGITALLAFAMFMGFWVGVFGTLIVQPFVVVLGLLLLLALWMATDTDLDMRKQITMVFLWFVGFVVMWPGYLAVDIPGLPWLTPTRIALALLMFMLLLQMSQSAPARNDLVSVLLAIRLPLTFYALFWLFALGTAAMAKSPAESFVLPLQWLVLWNMPFLAAAWVLVDPRAMRRMVNLLMICFAILCVLTTLEYINRAPIWFGYIPSFLKIDGPMFDNLMQEQVRLAGGYRARGNFAVHLFFVQFVLMLIPFVIHASLAERGRKRAASIGLLLFAVVVIWMTNTRTAMVGLLVVSAASFGLYALRRYLNPSNKADLVAPSIAVSIAGAFVAALLLISISPRLKSQFFGNSASAGSDVVRQGQWERAFAALADNPIGYGASSSGPIAGRWSAQGTWIVDSTWINFLVDFGIPGAFGFLTFGAILVLYGVRIYLKGHDRDSDLAGPTAVAIFSFLVTMITISFAGNFVFLLLMAGALAAIRYRLVRDGLIVIPPRPGAGLSPMLGRTG